MREDNIGGRKNALIGGTRTFFFLSLSGSIAGAIYLHGLFSISLLLSISVISFVLVFFAVTAAKDQNSSFSDELSGVIAHILSFLWVLNILPQSILLAAFIAMIFILGQRDAFVSLGKKVSVTEASEITSFLAIALIILPFLPNVTYSLSDIGVHPEMFGFFNTKVMDIVHQGLFNPYKTWFIVVFVSGIDIFGFLLKKAFASRSSKTSNVLPAILGGFVSSTSTTIGLAVRSKKESGDDILAAGAVLANVSSFFQLFVLLAPISLLTLRSTFWFLVGMSISGVVYAMFLMRKHKALKGDSKEHKAVDTPIEGEIFNLAPALRFAALLTTVKIVANLSLVIIGSTGFILTSLIASLTGVDAITITLADLVNSGSVTIMLAVSVFVLINAVNLVSKIFYSRMSGSKKFARLFTYGAGIMLLGGILFQVISVLI